MLLDNRIVTVCMFAVAVGCGGRAVSAERAGGGEPNRAGAPDGPSAPALGGAGGTSSGQGPVGTSSGGTPSSGAAASGGAASDSAPLGEASLIPLQPTMPEYLQPDARAQQGFLEAGPGYDELVLDWLYDIGAVRNFAVDKAGNIYLTTTRASALMRLDPTGKLLWAQHLAADCTSLVTDDDGNVYLSNTSADSSVTSLEKYTPNGAWVWGRRSPKDRPANALRMGRDGALYAAVSWGPATLWKLDLDGNTSWIWQRGGELGVTAFGADASGTVYLRVAQKPAVPLPEFFRGGNAPPDGLFVTLDRQGAQRSTRLFATGFDDPAQGEPQYLEGGPRDFVLTQAGDLLGGSSLGGPGGLFDHAGDLIWTGSLGAPLSAGRCSFCQASPNGAVAFDEAGEQTERLPLADVKEFAFNWAVDDLGNSYALVRNPTADEPNPEAIRRYRDSAWSKAKAP